MVIQTKFDNPLEQDIVFEETDETQQFEDILKNAENIIKSFLYLKEMSNASSPFVNSVIKMTTIDTSQEREEYQIDELTGKVFIKNISSTENYSIYFNNGEFVLFPYETLEFPVKEETVLETKGKFSIIESEYSLGKGD